MARRRKALPALLGAAALAIAGYWYWSPLLVVHQMRDAVRLHDAEAFNRHVDFPVLRENMKDQIAPDGIGRMLGGVLVDALVRPEAVMYVLEHGRFADKAARNGRDGDEQGEKRDDGERHPQWVSERDGLNRYIVRSESVALVFVRSGFADWKLAELRL